MLFVLNEAINTDSINQFKEGMLELLCIKKKPNHSFLKHETIYSLPIFTEHLFTNMNGQEEQEIFRFVEQMSPYEGNYINNEESANIYCKSSFNGFLGITFTDTNITITKQINNDVKYKYWCFMYSPDKRYLLDIADIHPDSKYYHFAEHHGKDKLTEFWKTIKNCPYIISAKSTNFGGNNFIREVYDDGIIEIVLQNTPRKYAISVQTTGKDSVETNAIAEIIKDKYER